MQLIFRYPSTFIDKKFRKFFNGYISSYSPFLPIITDEEQFKRMRQNILKQPTHRQSQVAFIASIADLTTAQKQQNLMQPMNIIKNTNKPDTKFEEKLIIHYTHENRFHSFKRDMHRLLENTFSNQTHDDTKLIVGNRNRYDAKKELIRKRPKQALLKNTTQKSK